MAMENADSARREAFLEKGLELLASEGHRSLTIARLTRELQVTSGSFYWHFKSAGSYQTTLLEHWGKAVERVIERAHEEGDGDQSKTFRSLARAVREAGTFRYDDAIRRWARDSEEAARMLRQADRRRAEVLAEFIGAEDSSDERVEVIGAAWRGSSGMNDEERRFRLLALTTGEGLRNRRENDRGDEGALEGAGARSEAGSDS